ncbi:FMN reductase [Mesorhizobium loti]|nr:FMN reductase [Mesorhizobium loti]
MWGRSGRGNDGETAASRPHELIAFVGSARRTKAHMLVGEVSATLRQKHRLDVDMLDLSDTGPSLCTLSRAELDSRSLALVETIERCNGLIIGCPVFQGSYPGLFKHVFDLVSPRALRNKPVLITAVGGGLRHSLVVEHQLRPLFGFFEAATVSTAIYACAEDLIPDSEIAELLQARITNAAQQFATLVSNPAATTMS